MQSAAEVRLGALLPHAARLLPLAGHAAPIRALPCSAGAAPRRRRALRRPRAAAAQASKLPAAFDRAWEQLGGGPADLVFPEPWLGVWQVQSTLTNVQLPLGADFVPDPRVRRPPVCPPPGSLSARCFLPGRLPACRRSPRSARPARAPPAGPPPRAPAGPLLSTGPPPSLPPGPDALRSGGAAVHACADVPCMTQLGREACTSLRA